MLTEMDGIERALIDVEDGEVKIQFDETKVSEERIAITLQQHGFHIS
jgi:copper chaperone CopZ